MTQTHMRRGAWQLVILAMLMFGGIQTATAGIIGTQDLVASEHRDANLAKVESALARSDVQQQLTAMGVDPANAAERAGSLSDAELQQLANDIDALPAGQGAGEVLIVLLIVFLVLELTGVTNFF